MGSSLVEHTTTSKSTGTHQRYVLLFNSDPIQTLSIVFFCFSGSDRVIPHVAAVVLGSGEGQEKEARTKDVRPRLFV